MKFKTFTFEDLKVNNPMFNHYIAHAEEMWDEIEAVQKGDIPFRSHHQSMLANAYEMYCKGYLELKLDDEKSGYRLSQVAYNDLFDRHNLKGLVHEIYNQGFLPLMPKDRYEQKDFDKFLVKMKRDYTDTRYERFAEFDEFKEAFDTISVQRQMIICDICGTKELTPSERLRQQLQSEYDLEE